MKGIGFLMDRLFFINALLFGIGLAMDAFSVSLANGLGQNKMSKKMTLIIPVLFSLFQFIMPLIGWLCVRFLVEKFIFFSNFIPFIALILLLYIGGKMLWESVKSRENPSYEAALTISDLLLQAIATSIDALSVGFTIANLDFSMALVESLIIGAVTFVVCTIGVTIGKKLNIKSSSNALMLGGIILIFIGLEIFFKGVI